MLRISRLRPRHLVALLVAASLSAPLSAADGELRWQARDGSPLPFRTNEEALDFLTHAEIVEVQSIPTGVTEPKRVVLERDGVTVRAAFHYHDIVNDKQLLAGGDYVIYFRDTYVNQVAAWEIGRLLGLENHPPTVLREVDGQMGSLQLWIENALVEGERRRQGVLFPDPERAREQVADMDVFDALINNLDRTQGNFLWSKANWDLWLIDHTRSLGRNRGLYEPDRLERCSRRLWTALNDLDKRALKRALAPYLSPQEVAAVLARRKALIEIFEQKIEAEGEETVLF